VSTFSFNGNKIVTTGGGGMLLTDDATLADYARHLSTQAKSHPIEYQHDEVGFNYRMPALNAALGLAQLERLPQFLTRKREVFERYNAAFAHTPQVCPFRPALHGLEPNHWLYTVAAERSRELEAHLRGLGIETRKLWQPLPQQQAFADLHEQDYPVAASVYEASLSLPCSTGITDAELEEVVAAIKEFYR
jgi:dTDP-4-amino-4,6-dideoxygalactose transaminase